jgi:hypothetical protein
VTPVAIIDSFIETEIGAGNPDSYVTEEWVPWCESKLKAAHRKIWNAWDWDFRFRRQNLAVSANSGRTALPADFAMFGTEGGIFITEERKLRERSVKEILLKQNFASPAGTPEEYAVGKDPDVSESLWYAYTWPIYSSALTLPIRYERASAVISYADDEGLELYPDEFENLFHLYLKWWYELRANPGMASAEAQEAKSEFYSELKTLAARFRQDRATIEQVGDEGPVVDAGMF